VSELDAETREALVDLDPRWMSGEYLPPYLRGEVEIARITVASVSEDVYSIRARTGQRRIRYRVVDEYESAWRCTPASSRQPLTMLGLIGLIHGLECGQEGPRGFIANQLWWQARDGASREEMLGWLRVGSDFYPQLEDYFRDEIQAWVEANGCWEDEEEDEEPGEGACGDPDAAGEDAGARWERG
jgi:hypothetical protein